ncbi:hypothetical protein PN498_22475 [Oscillatoria sp. CS-180]|uniref:hypothetical protein n=1 Tax=Oscillatoria sp. CS-180 TaxID=3021720 RepID=UPI00232BBC45|nr:hypothetical protein [Oscillatoria sp. CS-180]MDB9528775.1 hypothetical protein [Oscillatoria sp. CS-180]
MSNLETNVFNEAVDAWFQHCEISNIVPQQPSLEDSSVDDLGMVTLRNSEGFLARYSSKRKRIVTNL